MLEYLLWDLKKKNFCKAILFIFFLFWKILKNLKYFLWDLKKKNSCKANFFIFFLFWKKKFENFCGIRRKKIFAKQIFLFFFILENKF
jgi:hypothetical protein